MSANVWPVDAVTGAPSYTGRLLRQLAGLLWGRNPARPLGARSGVVAGTPTTIASATSSTWTVTPFGGVIDGETSAVAGGYNFSFDANVTGSVNAADATNPRIDLLYVRVSDPAEGDGSAAPIIELLYLAGTAAATPAAPATPARSIPLANILVPRATFGSPVTTLVAPWAVAAGGILPVSAALGFPASPSAQQYVDHAVWGLHRFNGTDYSTGLTTHWQGRQGTTFTSLSDGVAAKVAMDVVDVDTASLGFSGGQFTAPVKGVYRVSGSAKFTANATGQRQIFYQANAATIAGSLTQIDASAGTLTVVGPTKLVALNAGDTLSLWALQNSGGTLALVAGSLLAVERC